MPHGAEVEDLLVDALTVSFGAGHFHRPFLLAPTDRSGVQELDVHDILTHRPALLQQIDHQAVLAVHLEPVFRSERGLDTGKGPIEVLTVHRTQWAEDHDEPGGRKGNFHGPWYVRALVKVQPMSSVRLLLSFMLLALVTSVTAQHGFRINGRFKIEAGDLRDARVVVIKDGQEERSLTDGLSRFDLMLDYGHKYVLEFRKEGYVTKKILFNTDCPPAAQANGFAPFEFAVSLFKQYDDVNIVVFNQPVGIIRYEAALDDFDYDTDYTKSIQSQLDEALARTEEKEKEEEQRQKEAAKEAARAQKQAEKEQERLEKERQEAEARAAEEARRAAEEARAAEEKRKQEEAQARADQEQRRPDPAPVVKEEPKPRPKPVPPPPPAVRNELMAKATAGSDTRRSFQPRVGEEESRMEEAQTRDPEPEQPVLPEAIVADVVRTEDLAVEPNKVVTTIVLESVMERHEYKRIAHRWGGTFYFKDGAAITQEIYEREALTDRLVQAGGR